MIFIQNFSIVPGWHIIKEFTLIISYVDKSGKKVNYNTPAIGFNPIKYLATRNCNVYLYNDELYVSDFDVNYNRNYSLWSNDSDEIKHMQEKNQKFKSELFNSILLPCIIIFTIFIVMIIIPLIIGIISKG